MQPDDFKRFLNKNTVKKRPKFYDPITDNEDEIQYHNQSDYDISEDSEDDTTNLTKTTLQNKRKRLNKGPLLRHELIVEADKDLLKA